MQDMHDCYYSDTVVWKEASLKSLGYQAEGNDDDDDDDDDEDDDDDDDSDSDNDRYLTVIV